MIKKISTKTRMGWISAYENEGKIFKIAFRKEKKQVPSIILKKFKKKINDYFKKKTFNIIIPYKLTGNSNQIRVWVELKKIKKGQTKTYGQIAKKFNLSPRHIGKICGQNKLPLVIPCHRVIKSDGKMGGFSAPGGIILKRKLINFEKL